MFEWDEQVGIFSGDGDDVRHFEGPLLSPPGKADSGMWLGQDGTFRAVTWRSMNRWCQRKAALQTLARWGDVRCSHGADSTNSKGCTRSWR